MSENFSLEDIFNVMIELETLGNIHYNEMTNFTKDAKLKLLFQQLAAAELSHKKVYERLKSEVVHFNQEKVSLEYQEYIEALLSETILFLKESRNISDFEGGFEIAIRLEKDTILFLNELRSIVKSSFHEVINQIITQEQSHLKALYQYKKNM